MVHSRNATEVANESDWSSGLLVCTVIFVKHFELRVVVLGPSSRGRGEYGSNYDNIQQKNSISFFKSVLIAVCLY